MTAGDLVFVHGSGVIARGIQAAEWLRHGWRGSTRPGARWNHVAVLDRQLPTGEWTVVQAEGRGVTAGARLSTLGEHEVVALPPQLTRALGLAWLRAEVGRRYGFVTIASILCTLFTPWFVNVMLPGTWICSALGRGYLWACGMGYHGPDLYQETPARVWIELRA